MRVEAGVFFAIIPEWILDADIKATSVRLYGVLCRFADNKTGALQRSRREIAQRMRCSRDTVDRAVKELESIGAITVDRSQETVAGDSDRNVYQVHVTPFGGPEVQQGSRNFAATGGRKDAAGVAAEMRHKELESLVSESQESESGAATTPAAPTADHGWPEHLRPVLDLLRMLRGAVDAKALADYDKLFDPSFWIELEVLTEGTDVFLTAELRKYVTWWPSKGTRRHRDLRKGLRNWIKNEIDRQAYRKDIRKENRRAG